MDPPEAASRVLDPGDTWKRQIRRLARLINDPCHPRQIRRYTDDPVKRLLFSAMMARSDISETKLLPQFARPSTPRRSLPFADLPKWGQPVVGHYWTVTVRGLRTPGSMSQRRSRSLSRAVVLPARGLAAGLVRLRRSATSSTPTTSGSAQRLRAGSWPPPCLGWAHDCGHRCSLLAR